MKPDVQRTLRNHWAIGKQFLIDFLSREETGTRHITSFHKTRQYTLFVGKTVFIVPADK